MAVNNIELMKQYVPLLDKVYQKASVTSVLDGQNSLVRQGANANEILVPKMSMQGLANYDKDSGYKQGSVTLEYETMKCDYDRGRKFMVDNLDNQETANIAFGQLAGEFIRTKVAPELDAWRLGKYASTAGIGSASGTLSDGKAVVAALRKARDVIENAEADLATCVLFINPALLGAVDDLDTTASRKVLEGFGSTVKVPAARFFTTVTLGEDGFTGATPINFLIVDKQAVQQYQKHVVPKMFNPDQNQDADAYIYTYRTVGLAEVYDNKKAGVYCHTQASGSSGAKSNG